MESTGISINNHPAGGVTMNRKVFQVLWVAVLIVSATLACNFINRFQEDLGETRSTAVSVLTQAQGVITQAEAWPLPSMRAARCRPPKL